MLPRKHEYTHARHDPVHCMAPGLFRSLQRGERRRAKLEVVYDFGQGKRIEFSGPEPLGADDLRVLQGLVAMCGPGGLLLSAEPETHAGQQLRSDLFFGEPAPQEAMVVRGSYRALACAIGYRNPDDTQAMRDCIERLWKVSIIVNSSQERRGFRLLSSYASASDGGGKLYVAINPLIANAVMAGRQHVRICMHEVRAIQSDPTRLVHQRLCGWIDAGKSGTVTLDTVCGYIRPDKGTPAANKKRRQTARKALRELASIGWSVREYARGKWEVTRPAGPVRHVNVPQPPR